MDEDANSGAVDRGPFLMGWGGVVVVLVSGFLTFAALSLIQRAWVGFDGILVQLGVSASLRIAGVLLVEVCAAAYLPWMLLLSKRFGGRPLLDDMRRGEGDWHGVSREVFRFAILMTLALVPKNRPTAPEFEAFFGFEGWPWPVPFVGTSRWWWSWALLGLVWGGAFLIRRVRSTRIVAPSGGEASPS